VNVTSSDVKEIAKKKPIPSDFTFSLLINFFYNYCIYRISVMGSGVSFAGGGAAGARGGPLISI